MKERLKIAKGKKTQEKNGQDKGSPSAKTLSKDLQGAYESCRKLGT